MANGQPEDNRGDYGGGALNETRIPCGKDEYAETRTSLIVELIQQSAWCEDVRQRVLELLNHRMCRQCFNWFKTSGLGERGVSFDDFFADARIKLVRAMSQPDKNPFLSCQTDDEILGQCGGYMRTCIDSTIKHYIRGLKQQHQQLAEDSESQLVDSVPEGVDWKDELELCLQRLTDREREAFCFIRRELRGKDLADRWKTSAENVSQIASKALRKVSVCLQERRDMYDGTRIATKT